MVIPDRDDGCFGRECLHILMVSACERLLACMTSLAVLLRLAYRLQTTDGPGAQMVLWAHSRDIISRARLDMS